MASHVHCRVVSPGDTQPQDELFLYIADEHPNIQSALSQSQPSQRLSHAVPVSPPSASLTKGIVRPEPTCKRHCRRRCLALRQSRMPQRRWSHVTAFPASSRQQPVCPQSWSRNLLSRSSRLTLTALILLSSWSSALLLLAGTHVVSKFVEMFDNQL
jgi:hypothetical protein